MACLLPTEVVTVRAADLDSDDVVELPELVHVWEGARWVGKLVANNQKLGLGYPRWHPIYALFDPLDYDANYADVVGASNALAALQERYLLLRLATEQPMDRGHAELFVALHEFDLVRVQRRVQSAPVESPASPAWVVLEHEGTAVHWNYASPGLEVFIVDWDTAENDREYTRSKLTELQELKWLPDNIREQLKEALER